MPNILAIETSYPAASISLKLGKGPTHSEYFESHRQQNQLLFSPLKKLLALIPDGEKIDTILIGTGPGSYSGSRIAIAAAQGIAVAHDCPVVGQSSFLATETWLAGKPSIAVGDARRGSFFTAEIPTHSLPQEPQLMDREVFDQKVNQAAEALFSLDPTMDLSGDQALLQEIASAEQHIAAWLILSEKDKQTQLNTQPSPVYLRGPFITKAKAGHPLLRGKVNKKKT
ncbi:MAG: tRNA (adenosine(37)-N6)-threonylcarbamoyltransferase complex dimerization subunit type 1 TsaB [Rubritalea sp.]|uniref:tRNA (adenosine(37)-N6)-threonylcarbamoyltransferase complex dimerization subunit type 1 TsaB n=1 Tax=Rubritalea sp. TaxID=2109375 RepID=UPI003242A9C1